MIKIETFGLFRLHNNEHFQFMTDVDALIVKHTVTELGIDGLYTSFKNALTVEDTALRAELGSSRSKAIEEQDKLRDRTWNAIYTRTKSSLLSPMDDEVASAEAVMRIFDINGDIRNLPYNEESAAMSALTTNLLLPTNANHLEKVGITTWVNLLKTQNEEFQTLFNERNAEFAGRTSGDVRAARRVVDPLYEQIVERINAMLVLGTAKAAASIFAADLNERIGYYKATLTARSSRSKSKNKDAAATETKS